MSAGARRDEPASISGSGSKPNEGRSGIVPAERRPARPRRHVIAWTDGDHMNIVRRWWNTPRKAPGRAWVFQLHLYAGLGVGLLLTMHARRR
jgi:hypothetical protein